MHMFCLSAYHQFQTIQNTAVTQCSAWIFIGKSILNSYWTTHTTTIKNTLDKEYDERCIWDKKNLMIKVQQVTCISTAQASLYFFERNQELILH